MTAWLPAPGLALTATGTWMQVAQGELWVDNRSLREGDRLALDEPERVRLDGARAAEMLLFDLLAAWNAV